jgi:hypothetical protein
MERFGNLSGLRLNRKKTEGMWLGRLRHCKEQFENITWTKDMAKCLGVHFGHGISKCQQSNIEKQLQKNKRDN